MRHFSQSLPVALIVSLFPWTANAAREDLVIESEWILEASREEVWRAWTTPEGIRSFFAPACNIELEVDGLYEIFFTPDAEPGQRGADNMRILVLEPMERLAFTWNAPTSLPNARRQRTRVTLVFESLGEHRTRLEFRHDGFGRGDEWRRAHEYFTQAWNGVVLPRLVASFTGEP